jgi:putative flippase GtrA
MSLVADARAWASSHQGKKLIRYTLGSAISTAVSFASLLLIFGVFHLFGEVASTVAANAIATVPSYYLNRNWAWGKSGKSHLTKEILPFWGMACLGIVVSMGGASLAKHLGQHWHMAHLGQTILVLVANVLSFGVFWILKLLLFNRLFHFELDEFDEHLTHEEEDAATKGTKN